MCPVSDDLTEHEQAMPDTEQINRLLNDAAELVQAVDDATEDTPDERTRRRTHELRQTVGVLLILSERLARDTGNDSMVTLDRNGDGTGTASFTVNLADGLDVALADN